MADGVENSDWRSGLVQAMGVIIGFSLGFLGSWSLGEGNWELIHLPAVIFLVVGNLLLIISLYKLTMPVQIGEDIRKTVARLFTVGLSMTLLGFVLAIAAAAIVGD